jgi:hypothetical protein
MSNSRILSKVPSDLANTANGKLLSVENGEIVWQQNYAFDVANTASANTLYLSEVNNTQNTNIDAAFNRANSVSIPFFTYNNTANNINITSDDKLPFYVYSGQSSNVSLIKV